MMDALFTPGATTTISASTTTARGALAITGAMSVAVVNAASGIAFVKFGSSTVEATTADTPILGSSTRGFCPPANATHMAVILSTGTGSVYVTCGAGA